MSRTLLPQIALTLVLLVGAVAADTKVLETAAKNGCMKLMALVTKAGLKHALDSTDGVTLFAPSDAAIDAIPDEVKTVLTHNVTLLQEVLKFHVVSGALMSSNIKNEDLLPTLSGSLKLRTNVYMNAKVVTAQGSPVSKPDLKASNGVVHVIDKVIYPLPTLNTPLFMTFDKDLNNLGYMTYQANLIANFSEQALTVFAPSNEAIKQLPGQQYNDLLMNLKELTSVVTYHVIKGTVFSAGLQDGQKVTTLEGQQLDIKIDSGTVTVNGAKVTQADISTTNGAIHVIDTLLFPPKQPTIKLFDVLIPILG